jgi:hypothetical protein
MLKTFSLLVMCFMMTLTLSAVIRVSQRDAAFTLQLSYRPIGRVRR